MPLKKRFIKFDYARVLKILKNQQSAKTKPHFPALFQTRC
ncbi:hypothetical protein HMPREF1139_1581 [Campylobacter sp. FOBRC14]|nr:hypothetical protein HMPREF1139_1581 [Campylobacter sp. FOBRC14]